MLRFLLIIFLLLLCQCATQHQASVFPPYFYSQPEEILSESHLLEIAQLEEGSVLEPLAKKRLLNLYLIELNHLGKTSSRALWVQERVKVLKNELESLELIGADESLPSSPPQQSLKPPVSSGALGKLVQAAYQAWNQDDNEKALILVEELLQSEDYKKITEPAERNRILNLYFRVAFDLRSLEKCQKAYELLKEQGECSSELSQAGELFAIFQWAENRAVEGRQTLLETCQHDPSASAKLRRSYWLFRLSEPQSSEQKSYWNAVQQFPVPGYYHYLAASHLGKECSLPPLQERPRGSYSLPSQVNEWVQQAEERLRVGLRKEANLLLLKAKKELLKNPGQYLVGIVHLSELFQATGNHLEAMKLVSSLLYGEYEPQSEVLSDPLIISEFMRLYHQPFKHRVEWLSKNWGVDPDFVYSIMRQESAFNPGAVSVAGARGLMQLMPVLGRFLMEQWKTPLPTSKGYLFRGTENLKLATYHLNQLNQIAPHPALVAAAYNAGINRVSTWWARSGHYPLDVFIEFIPVNETRNYVKLVLRNLIYYKGLREGGKVPSNIFSFQLPPAPFLSKALPPHS